MEMEKVNASNEIENLKGKIDEIDIKVFADNFLYILEVNKFSYHSLNLL